MTESSSETPTTTRRNFLKLAWAFFGGIAILEASGMAMAYLQPRLTEGEFGSIIKAGAVDDFPPNSVTHISDGRFYVVRLPDGGFLAIYQRCTHLGCTVPWDANAGTFLCPCHSSEFDMEGSVQNPPAPRPLDLFAVSIVDGSVMVDTGNPIQRSTFETAQVVYP